MKHMKKLKVCSLCGRQDNGAQKCRDHPPLPESGAVLAELKRDE